MEVARPQPKEKSLKVLYSCSAGFKFEIEYVDPDGQGFAFGKYRAAIDAKHRAFHREQQELTKRISTCTGLVGIKVKR